MAGIETRVVPCPLRGGERLWTVVAGDRVLESGTATTEDWARAAAEQARREWAGSQSSRPSGYDNGPDRLAISMHPV